MNSTFHARWLVSLEVISQVLLTSEQPKKNKMTFVGILSQVLFGPLVIQLSLKVVDIYLAASRLGKYPALVYTKTVDSAERARWLARQTPNILHYLPPSNSGKMASRFASVASEEIIQNKLFVVHFISLF